MEDFAPVIVFGYNRLDHLKDALSALNKNDLSNKTDLFIFLDGPKNERDKTKTDEVMLYAREFEKLANFKCVFIKNKIQNVGLANSVISGVSEIINIYGKVIVVEDDLVVSEDFLTYMNGALNYYRDNDAIWSISGYTYDLKKLEKYSHDVYMGKRASSWGWATWKDRWDTVDWSVKKYGTIKYNLYYKYKFSKCGNDLPGMLKAQMKGQIDSWAVRWCFQQSIDSKYTVYPKKTKVLNYGFDGSGTHCGVSDSFDISYDLQRYDVKFENLSLDRELMKEYKRYIGTSLVKKIKFKINKMQRMINNK